MKIADVCKLNVAEQDILRHTRTGPHTHAHLRTQSHTYMRAHTQREGERGFRRKKARLMKDKVEKTDE